MDSSSGNEQLYRASDEPNPLHVIVRQISTHFRQLILVPLGVGVLGVILAFVLPRTYRAESVFAPAEDLSSALSGPLQDLAQQFGMVTPGGGYSIYYFAQVIQTREVLEIVAADTLEAPPDIRKAVLDELRHGQLLPQFLHRLFEAGESDAVRLDRGIRSMRKVLDVRTDDQSNLVTLRVTASTPPLAEALANSILRALNTVITKSVQRGGSSERRFAESQVQQSASVLRTAEEAYRDFLQSNRTIAESPKLQFEDSQLRRRVQMAQELYIALTNQFEAAKLREVRNTPAISIVQLPRAELRKASPRASVFGLFGSLGAFCIVATWIYLLGPFLASHLNTRPTAQRFPAS
jgi:uncharacterized protein involved in exopolysaccharide biosynthesis